MKNVLILLITFAISSLTANAQKKEGVKRLRPKMKNDKVLIVPDQKPVIIERKEGPVFRKNSVPPGRAKKLYGAKSAKTFAPGHRKKPVLKQR